MAENWLSLGEVVARYRTAGYEESEQTIRREIDDACEAGEVQWYRTRSRLSVRPGHRRVLASDVEALIAVKNMPPGTDRDEALRRRRAAVEGHE